MSFFNVSDDDKIRIDKKKNLQQQQQLKKKFQPVVEKETWKQKKNSKYDDVLIINKLK